MRAFAREPETSRGSSRRASDVARVRSERSTIEQTEARISSAETVCQGNFEGIGLPPILRSLPTDFA